jgi:HD-GYP domain-containing protein (c-di-GMP phosphodiesterase class II)
VQIDGERQRVLTFHEDEGRVRFGRAHENHLVLPRNYVSRFHGEFVFADGHWSITDQGSRAGTRVGRNDDPSPAEPLLCGAPRVLQGGDEIRILGISMRIEIKSAEDRSVDGEEPNATTMIMSRLAETQIAEAPSLERVLLKDRKKLELVLELAKDLNRLESLDEVLRRISVAVFGALPNSTHFSICVPGPDGRHQPRFGILRDGQEPPLDEVAVSQSILELVVARKAAMLFQLGDQAVDPSASVLLHSIAASIAVPLRGSRGHLGVLLVDNRSSASAFDGADLDYMIVLANHATFALERAQFQAEIGRMFEGFVDASVTAIEARDPTTSGHSRRVANYAVALAEAANRHEAGRYASVAFTEVELTEISYAALLHDFGKVGISECVLVKASRLYPEQLAAVEDRFRLIRASRRNELLLEALTAKADGAAQEDALAEAERQFRAFEGELSETLAFIRGLDAGGPIDGDQIELLRQIAQTTFVDPESAQVPYLTDGELESLCIRRGTLTDADRREIQAHVPHSVRVLQQIPWPDPMRRIPEIVAAHHEKLDGTGYPAGLRDAEIGVESRLLAVVDIFDAVTAADRPYRSAMPLERALDLLREESGDGKIDADLVALFIDAEIWRLCQQARSVA